MKFLISLVVCVIFCHLVTAGEERKVIAPNVQVYSRNPGKYGEKNVLICHASGFHPPEIKIELLKNGNEIPDAKQTDLAFEENWHYHLTKHVAFTPMSGETYVCRVTHVGIARDYSWESDM